MSSKLRKTILWKEETVFGEAYDKDATGYQKLACSEITVNRVTEKIETTELSVEKENNIKSTDGRVTGKLSLSKPLDGSFYSDHLALTEAGLGKLITPFNDYPSGLISLVTGTTEITVSDPAFLEVGDIVAISDLKSSYNIVESINAAVVTLKYPMAAGTLASIVTGTDTLIQVPKISPAQKTSKYFKFICIYDDDTVEVLTGAKPAMSFEVPMEGKIEIKIEVLSATINSEDELDIPLVQPTTTLLEEGDYDTFYVDFKKSWIYDAVTEADKAVCPYNYTLKVDNTLEVEKSSCAINGVKGYKVTPTITGEITVSKNAENLITFNKKNGVNPEQYIFMSQENFAIYAEKARFTGLDLSYSDDFDSIKLNTDVNWSSKYYIYLGFPY